MSEEVETLTDRGLAALDRSERHGELLLAMSRYYTHFDDRLDGLERQIAALSEQIAKLEGVG